MCKSSAAYLLMSPAFLLVSWTPGYYFLPSHSGARCWWPAPHVIWRQIKRGNFTMTWKLCHVHRHHKYISKSLPNSIMQVRCQLNLTFYRLILARLKCKHLSNVVKRERQYTIIQFYLYSICLPLKTQIQSNLEASCSFSPCSVKCRHQTLTSRSKWLADMPGSVLLHVL